MDEQDFRLRARLERLAAAVPLDASAVVTEPVRRSPVIAPRRLLAGAVVALAAAVLAVGGLGLTTGLPPREPVASAGQGVSGTPATTPPGTSTAVSPAPAASNPGPPSSGPSTERSGDGIPTAYDGQPVLRGEAAVSRADGAADTTPFLVGGWLTVQYGILSCPMELPVLPAWARSCGAPALSDSAGGSAELFWRRITFRLLQNGFANPVDGLRTGPVIVRVHVHDPRAPECGDAADVCGAMMVVDQVLWTGDAATAPGPITPAAALAAVASVDAGAFTVDGPGVVHASCGGTLPSALYYERGGAAADRPAVTSIEVLPTAAARERALPQAEGASGAFTKAALVCRESSGVGAQVTSSESRWLVVANVAVMVQLHAPASTADRQFVARLSRALEAAATAAAGSNP